MVPAPWKLDEEGLGLKRRFQKRRGRQIADYGARSRPRSPPGFLAAASFYFLTQTQRARRVVGDRRDWPAAMITMPGQGGDFTAITLISGKY